MAILGGAVTFADSRQRCGMIRRLKRGKTDRSRVTCKIGQSRLSAGPDKHQRQDRRPDKDCLTKPGRGDVLAHDGVLAPEA